MQRVLCRGVRCLSRPARGAQGRRSRAAASAVGRAAARLASQRPPIRAAALAWLEATAARREPEQLALRGPGDLGAPLRAARAAAGSPEVRNKSTRVCDTCRALVGVRWVPAGRTGVRCCSLHARQPAQLKEVRRVKRALLRVERAGPPCAATRASSARDISSVNPRPARQAAEWAELLARALRALAAAPGNRPAILDAGALPDLCAALAAPAAAPAAAETLALLAGDARLAALPAPPLRALLALLGARAAQAAGTGGDGDGPGAHGAGGGGADKTPAAAAAAARALAQLMRSAPNRCPAAGMRSRGGLRQSRRCYRDGAQPGFLSLRLVTIARAVLAPVYPSRIGSTHVRSWVPRLSQTIKRGQPMRLLHCHALSFRQAPDPGAPRACAGAPWRGWAAARRC